MKEYIAKTGGRYTYNDDLLNLQDLAASMTAIFDGCSNFIISGCEFSDGRITPGYVWINGKVRYFEGGNTSSFPYYIYERNQYETITYAGDVSKHGRCNYLSAGSTVIPQNTDEVTGKLPSYIEMKQDYSPRFIDKFFGKYAVLVDSPFAKQTVKKELVLTGNLTGEKDIQSKTAVSVVNPENGYELRNIVKITGDASMGVYHNGLLLHEIVIDTSGNFTLYRNGIQVAQITAAGLVAKGVSCQTGDCGSIRLEGSNIFNHQNNTDDGSVNINQIGYEGGKTRFRSFNVFDGKGGAPLFSVDGKNAKVTIDAPAVISNAGSGLQLINPNHGKNDALLRNSITWLDKDASELSVLGFTDTASLDFTFRNIIGNIVLTSLGWVDVRGELRVRGVDISDTYVNKTDHQNALNGKVDKVAGKQLSTEDFTTVHKQKLESILTADLSGGGSGFVTAADVSDALKTKLTISKNLADVPSASTARSNLELYSRTESDARYFRITNALSEAISLSAAEVEGKSPEDIIKLKEQRQQAVRDNIDAEKKGTG